jgi:predicted nucleotidyltransferase
MKQQLVRRLREAAPRAFEGQPVVFAYLFGSHATGGAPPRSDVDIAVYVEDSGPPDSYFDLRLRLPSAFSSAGIGEVNVVVLNETRSRSVVVQSGTAS